LPKVNKSKSPNYSAYLIINLQRGNALVRSLTVLLPSRKTQEAGSDPATKSNWDNL